jgi:Tfp pilus assembly protein PilP
MRLAMIKTKTGVIVAIALAAGLAAAQNPSIIQDTRATMNGVRDNAAAASNAALSGMDQAPSAPAAHPVSASAPVSSAPKVTAHKAGVKAAHAKPSPKPEVKASPMAPKAGAASTAPAEPAAASAAPAPASEPAAENEKPTAETKFNTAGKRDPFISPVVSHGGGSGCSTGKKCLEIGEINLRGIVHSESGFIAVVSNGLNKAYFLRENDPVFNGYVMKITGDSIVFQETLQDRLGKTFTREVTKKITTPAV